MHCQAMNQSHAQVCEMDEKDESAIVNIDRSHKFQPNDCVSAIFDHSDIQMVKRPKYYRVHCSYISLLAEEDHHFFHP